MKILNIESGTVLSDGFLSKMNLEVKFRGEHTPSYIYIDGITQVDLCVVDEDGGLTIELDDITPNDVDEIISQLVDLRDDGVDIAFTVHDNAIIFTDLSGAPVFAVNYTSIGVG